MNAVEVKSSIDRQGYALLRGAIPVDRIVRYRDALDAIYTGRESNGDVSPQDFLAASNLHIEGMFAEPLEAARHVLGDFYPGQSVFMSVSAGEANSSRGIPFHTDGIAQGTTRTVLSMWAPLHDCGVEAPGIAIVPAPREEVLHYLRGKFPGKKLPGWHSALEWNDGDAFRAPELCKAFPAPITPAMAPGDVVIFTNWTIHGSYSHAGMKKRRSAAILRLVKRTLLQRLVNHELHFLGRAFTAKELLRGRPAQVSAADH